MEPLNTAEDLARAVAASLGRDAEDALEARLAGAGQRTFDAGGWIALGTLLLEVARFAFEMRDQPQDRAQLVNLLIARGPRADLIDDAVRADIAERVAGRLLAAAQDGGASRPSGSPSQTNAPQK